MSLLSDTAKLREAIKGHDALALKQLLAANNALSNTTFPEIHGESALALAAARQWFSNSVFVRPRRGNQPKVRLGSGNCHPSCRKQRAYRLCKGPAASGADVNAEGGAPFRSTPLLNAAQSGHLETVKLLIQLGADPVGPPSHYSALYAALYMRRASVVEYLLSIGVDVDVFSAILMGNRTALLQCLEKEPTCLLRTLPSYKWYLTDGPLPLHFAILCADISIVRLLCDNGANPYDETESGMTAMCVASISAAVGNANADAIIGYLRSRGVRTDLHSYVALGDLDQVRPLIGGKNELRDPLALCIASFLGRYDVLRLLMEGGIDVNLRLKSRPKESALVYALGRGGEEKEKVIQLLLDNGAKVGPIEVAIAIDLSNESMLRMVLRGNPDLNTLEEEGVLAPIHGVISDRRSPALLEVLLAHGADVNLRSGCMYKMTPLHLAVLSPSTAVPLVQTLLKYNADTDAKDAFFGERPLEWAKYAAFPKECPKQLVDLLQ